MSVLRSNFFFFILCIFSLYSVNGIAQDTTWYTLASGSWDDPSVWTLDPSGTLPKNPDNLTPTTAVTGTAQKVVILSGRTIDVYTNNKTNASLTVYGRIDFHATTGQTFSQIRGNGKIILKDDNFPAGDATHFITAGQGEGTVIFDSTGYDLATSQTFYNVEVNLDNTSDVLTLLADYQINGGMTITQGEFRINDNTSTTPLDLAVNGNVYVGANASISVGNANAYDGAQNYYYRYHNFTVGGDFVSYGVVRLTNQVVPDYLNQTSTGAVTLHFTGASDNYFKVYNTTDLYNLHVDKGTDATYELSVYAHNKAYFALFGPNSNSYTRTVAHPQHDKAFWIEAGSVRLKGEIVIPSLAEGGNDWSIGENASLIFDGENVEVYSTTTTSFSWTGFSHGQPDNISDGQGNQGISIYGNLTVENGFFSSSNSSGIIYRPEAAGSLKISGGEVNITQLRLTGSAASGFYSFIQTGGVFRVRGNGQVDNGSAIFSLDDPDMYFSMSGGQLVIDAASGFTPGALDIQCADGNYNVTGGEVVCNWGSTSQVSCVPNIYDLTITNATYADMSSVIEVSNDLSVDNTSTLGANGLDLSVGGDFIFADGAGFVHGNNTTYFIGSGNSQIIVENTTTPSDLIFYDLYIQKDKLTSSTYYQVELQSPGRSETAGVAANTAITVLNDITVRRGSLSTYRYTLALNGNIEIIDGEITANSTSPGRIELTGGASQHTLKGAASKEQSFGHIELDDANGVVLLSNINATDITLTNGMFDLDIYNLTITGTVTGYSGTRYFRSAGNASDGGLTLQFTLSGTYAANSLVAYFPVGVTALTPGEVYIDNYTVSSPLSGSIRVNPVNSYHPAARNISNVLNYYWMSGEDGFSSIPAANAYYRFIYSSNVPNNYIEHVLIDNDWVDASSGLNNTAILRYRENTFGLVDGEFTAGQNGEYNNRRILYSRKSGDWNDITPSNPMWIDQDGNFIDGGGQDVLPRESDICVVRNGNKVNVPWGVNPSIAKLVFDHDTTVSTGIEDLPRVQVGLNNTATFLKVTGTGIFTEWLDNVNDPVVIGDFGDFSNQKYSWFLFVASASTVTLPSTPVVFPNVMTEGSGDYLTFTEDIYINYNLNPRGSSTLLLNSGTNGDIYVGGDLWVGDWEWGKVAFPSTGNNRILSIDGNIDFTQSVTAPTADREIYVDNATPSSLEHQLIVGGDIIQDVGVIDLYNGTGTANNAILTISGESNSDFTKSGTPTTDFYRIEMEKLEGNSFTFNNDFSLNGPTSGSPKALELITGDLVILGSGTDITLTSGGAEFNIPAEASLTARNSIMRASGANTGIYLDGLMVVGDNSQWLLNGGTNNYIEYSSSGNAEIQVDNGVLRVGSQIRRNTITNDGILTFSQNNSSSTVVIGETNAPENRRGLFEIMNTGSSFTQTDNANITIVRSQTTPAAPTLYLDPGTSNIGNGSTITFGNSSTSTGQNMGIYSSVDLQNIVVDNSSGNNPTLSEWIIPLTINGDLTIEAGADFDANSLDLTIRGNFYNYGTFTPDNNTTYFDGTGNQRIVGNTTFYNLTKSSTGELWLAADNAALTINNNIDIQSGTVRDSSNTITILGDCNMDGTHIHGNQAGDGFYFNGTAGQILTGDGTFGKITIDNSSGITVPLGNNFTVTDTLKLSSGIFGIGKNLLTLTVDAEIEEDNPFSATNMIQTNVSFTDYGVRKYFPAGAKNFIYPIGSGGKYTPVTFDITANTSSTGYITVKAADEMHPSIQEDSETPPLVDAENVLQYHWVIRSNGITGFKATTYMKYNPGDVLVNSADYDVYDYITARLLNDGSGLWNKYLDVDKFDEINEWCIFDFGLISGVDDAQISGDYTAGIDDAIPDQVPFYETNNNGAWSTGSIWDPNITGGPRGAMVRINSGHTVTAPSNYISNYTTEIQGTVNLGTTFGHRFGEVSGSGLIYTEREVIPAGVYDEFFSSAGGTLEFSGTNDYDVLGGHDLVNNLTFSGTGLRRLPSNNITLNGDFKIDGGATLSVDNDNDIDIDLKGDLIRIGGSFDAGINLSNKISFTSAINQNITGTFTATNALHSLVVNNPNGLTISSGVVDIEGVLYLTNGTITTSGTDTLRVGVTATISPVSGSSASYINGPLTKVMSSGDDFTFPIGKAGGLGLIDINNIVGITGVDTDVSVEYFFSNPDAIGDVTAMGAGVNTVSQSEYWSVDVVGGAESTVEIKLDGSSDVANAVSDINDLIIVGWNGSQWDQVGGTYTITGTATSGTIACNSTIDYNSYQYITLGSSAAITLITATILTNDFSICSGDAASITLSFAGGTAPWTYTLNGTDYTAPTSPYVHNITPDPVATATYTLNAVEDALFVPGTVVGNTDITITVNANPVPTLSSSAGTTVCAGLSVIFTAGTGSNYDFYLNSALVQSGTASTYTNSTLANGDEIDVIVTSSTGCSSALGLVPVTMTVETVPSPVISGASNSCEGNTDTYSVAATGNNFTWSVTSDGSLQTVQGTENMDILWGTLTPVGTLQSTETVSVEEDNGTCTGTDTYDVVVNRVPQTGTQYHISNTWEN